MKNTLKSAQGINILRGDGEDKGQGVLSTSRRAVSLFVFLEKAPEV